MPKKLLSLLCAALLLLSALKLPALADDAVDPAQEQLQYQGETKKDESPADVKTPAEPTLQKLDSALLPLADEAFLPEGITKDQYTNQVEAQGDVSVSNGSTGEGAGEVYVYITLKEGSDPNLLAPYVNRIGNHKDTLVVAWVGMDRLAELAAVDCVISISQVAAPVVNKMDTSEGVGLHKADLAQALSTGAGVKVGVISDGVNHLGDAIATGDLPGNVTVLSDTRSGDEGTAMLEIVYDMAPNAQLFFHDCGADVLAFNAAVDALIAAGCSIIVDDISWVTEPFFEDGVVATHYKQILQSNDVLLLSSAGNAGDRHYQGLYYNSSRYPGWQDFSSGTSSNEDLYVRLAPGASLQVLLQWKEPFGSSSLSDYDLYLTNATGSYTYASRKTPNAVTTQPLERIIYTNPYASYIDCAVSVYRYNAPTPTELEIYIYGGIVYTNNRVKADSIYGHAAVPGVIACGAINPQTPDSIETFSSQGPVTTLSDARSKPDICGADGVDVTGAGGFAVPFYGTSAAAPHVAAIAALVKARYPQYTPSQIASLLCANSIDLGNPGYDSVYGNGLSNALAAVASSYYARFDSQGGSAVDTQLVAPGAVIGQPADPVRAGHRFGGWFHDAACTVPWDFGSTTVTQDTTLYAGWVAQVPSNYLRGIGLSAGALTRGFSAKTTSYTVNLGENEPAVTIAPDKAYDGAVMTIDGKAIGAKTIALANGKTATVTVKVALGKKAVTYKLKVQRAKSTANTLAAMNASAGTWSQPFDPSVTSYTLTLPENVGKVALSAARASGLSTVSPAKGSFNLKNGQTVKATFKVKAQSGATRTYTVLITRARSTNANLASLKLNVKGMAPGFNPAVSDYAITLPAKTASVTIAAKAADKLSTVRINGAKKASLAVKLANGQTATVTVTVVSQAGVSKNYTVVVNRTLQIQ